MITVDTIKHKRQERVMKSMTTTSLNSKKIEIPNNIREILRSVNSRIDVEQEAKRDVINKIENNEMNTIKFYDIMQVDNLGKKKGKGNFKSRRYPSDLALIRGTKFFSKPNYSNFEQSQLKQLKNSPGKLLLMSEIYSQLEENFENEDEEYDGQNANQDASKIQDFSNISVIKGRNATFLPSINQSSLTIDGVQHKDTKLEKEIEGLDHWYKGVKQWKKQQEKQQQDQQTLQTGTIEQSKQKQSRFFPRSKSRKLTREEQQQQQEEDDKEELLSPKKINERMKNFTQKNKDSVLLIAKKQFAELQNSREFSSSQPMTPESKKISNSALNNSRINLVNLLKNNPSSDEDTRKNSQNFRQRSDSIKDIFSNVVKEINEQTKVDDIPSNIRDIKNTVLKYVNDVPNLHTKEDSAFKKEDLTPEGIKRILQTFYSIDPDNESTMNMVEKAKNYEKISNLVEQKLLENLRDSEALITNKSNTVRILRLENHTIMKKMRQIKELSAKLQADIKEITVPNQNKEEQLLDPTVQKAPDIKKISLDSQPNTPMLPNKKGMNLSNMTTSNRSALIESVMAHTSRIHEIERENQILKESYQKFELKQHYNSEIIQSIEDQINQKRKDFKQLTKAKRTFLYEILKYGKDSRNEGLSWIIRAIQNLGEKVFDTHLPDFLDSKAKDFLLQKSQKIQEIQEIQTLQNVSLDIYKTNMSINDHMKTVDMPDQTIGDVSMIGNQNNISILSGLNKSQQNNLTLPSIKQNDNSKFNQSFSQVNVEKIKHEETLDLRKKIMTNLHQMFEGLSSEELGSLEKTIDQLHATKLTTNDIIYNETKKKIKTLLNTSMPDLNKKNQNSFNSQTQNQQPSANITNFLDNLEHEQIKLNHKIVLYENSTMLNKYDSREQFIQEYELLSKRLREKEKQLKQLEDKELIRVIKEYDYKNYEKRFGVKCGLVLSTLLGSVRADREIIKNGMNKR
ncbi:hypothetical protein TTHERM_00723030 (macronuclear) [Tetrahymena thermophila SB210]|uniref:Uncharacterized protein n=1 Tax=Tetrahymena thermophila (strain SB210) TaxID=312017 RepID=I7MFQ1_TETTS|nr:hypothetical protein TTHERM_00723030 [Tetrahymena thermophila SB210]EAR84118.2 hypothetical protein TTHERM_00723030 [Tetrahymena thermophila SB210]|eukprot:XP_001031781.2 hypothetical protein TTHERM_00723030 [Tetrahymena thermophila SB210]